MIEGFYGTPWSPRARLALVEFVASRQMNAFVYAPKGDPKHRDRWRDSYDATELREFTSLIDRCRRIGVRLGFALSPGLDVDYGSDADRAALLAKLAPLLDAGVDWIVLALDDIPSRPGLASDQARLAAWLLHALREGNADATLTLVPTEYVGTSPTRYLAGLAAELPSEIGLMWTGPTVCAPVIRAVDARGWRAAVGERPLLLWDNYPVNDGAMSRALHLGPYRGRDPALTDEVDGVLCNPMEQPYASRVAVATAAAFLSDPNVYDAEAAWADALTAVGGPRAGPLGALAAACADSPLNPADRLHAHALLDDIETALDDDWGGPAGALEAHLRDVRDACRAWSGAPDDPLGDELEPWLTQGRREAAAGLAALGLLRALRPEDGVDGARAEDLMLHAFATLFAWSAARAGEDRVVLGPRFTVYPAVVQLPGGRSGLDVDLALVEDRSATDRLCRLALREYRAWANVDRGAVPDRPV